jgi:hypothetical protein
MGILDSKSRWMDIHLTPIGRLQLANGNYNIKYWSISDRSSSYLSDGTNGEGSWLSSPDSHIILESWDKPQDNLTMFSDDYGEHNLSEFVVESDEEDLILSAKRVSANLTRERIQKVISSWSNDFNNISSVFINDVPKEFNISGESLLPNRNYNLQSIYFNEIDNLWECKEASNKVQFKYLPPVNKGNNQLGNYGSLTNTFNEFSFSSLAGKKPIATWNFIDQSFTSQFYLIDYINDIIKPLTVISRGQVLHENINKDIYSIGELIQVEESAPKFVNLFTLVVE